MPVHIGDGQARSCNLGGRRFPALVPCWVFRRIGFRVSLGIIEILAQYKLRDVYSLRHEDPVTIDFLPPKARMI